MRIISIHANSIEIEAKQKAIADAEEHGEKQRFEECLVVLSAVEKTDESVWESTAARAAEEVQKISNEV